MASRKDEMWVWTGYFDSRLSRSEGRRVPKEAAISTPTLEAVACCLLYTSDAADE